VGIQFIVRDYGINRKRLSALLLLAPIMAGCSGAADLVSRDAEWFSRPGRLFIRSISIDTPPLTPDKPVIFWTFTARLSLVKRRSVVS